MYRDLKPENVLLNADGHIKITDFGISKVFSQNTDIKTFSMCGTPEYIAPEVLKQKGYTFSSDWFSFVTLILRRVLFFMICLQENPHFTLKIKFKLYKKNLKNLQSVCQKRYHHKLSLY